MSDDQIYAGIVCKFVEFDPKTDTMTAYIERATIFLDANNLLREKWAAIFHAKEIAS